MYSHSSINSNAESRMSGGISRVSRAQSSAMQYCSIGIAFSNAFSSMWLPSLSLIKMRLRILGCSFRPMPSKMLNEHLRHMLRRFKWAVPGAARIAAALLVMRGLVI
jgi:hypothetical protein